MARLFHVSSTANRDSILAHGLDCSRKGAAPGIAGSLAPEADGVFLCAGEFEAGFFVEMNNTGGPVDVRAVTGIDDRELIDARQRLQLLPGADPGEPCRSGRAAVGGCRAATSPRTSEEAAENGNLMPRCFGAAGG